MMRFANGFHGMGRGFMGGGLGMLILLIIAVVVIYFIFRHRGHSSMFTNGSTSAMEILNERLARGEINEEEYKQKKALLMKR